MTDFAAENGFYLSCSPTRIAKLLAQHEAFKMTLDVPGAIVECGVFKGASFCRLAMFRQLFVNPEAKALVGFDTFGVYFQADNPRDEELRSAVISRAGSFCVGTYVLMETLTRKGCQTNVELVQGDIKETVPAYVASHPELRISLLNLDVDFYDAAKTVLTHFWPRVSQGGVMLLDDYGTFEGETRAVDEYFAGSAQIRRMPAAYSPCYLRKT